MTAYDLLDEISHHVPAPDKGKLDITELDIKPKKTYIKGTAETAAQVDDLVAELEKIDCFETRREGQDLVGDGAAVGRQRERREAARAQAVRPHHHDDVSVTGAAR